MAETTVPPGLRAGRLEGVSPPDLLWGLSERGCTGVLRVERDGVTKTLFLCEGRVVFASSSDPDDRLGEMLLRRGTITIGQLEDALLQLPSTKRLGTLMVEGGSLSAEQLVTAVVEQVKSIVLDLIGWDEGEYRFEENEMPTHEVITLERETADLLLMGVRASRSFTRIRRGVGVGRTVYALQSDWEPRADALSLNAAESAVLERLRQGETSVESLCSEVLLSNFETYRTLWAFRILGLVEPREVSSPVDDSARESGPIGAESFAEVLVRLARAGQDGVLYASRKGAERSFHLRDGRCVFATSNDPDDALMASALRRGVISLHDRERTARRLLSNKRVGEILLELGVIDRDDLTELVQAQLGEIVFDTFAWESGEYAFVPGALPSVERITLDRPLEALVADGVRRVNSWTQVVRGCGGIDHRMGLADDHLARLEAMGAGDDEREVVSALAAPQSPRRLCTMTEIGDFRTCQIFWALRLIGAVESRDERIDFPEVDEPEVDQLIAGVDTIADTSELSVPQVAAPPEPEPEPAPPRASDAVPPWRADSPRPVSRSDASEVSEVSGPSFDPSGTISMDTEIVREALRRLPDRFAAEESAEAVEPAATEPDWPLPEDAERTIDAFNAMHRLVWRALRSEIGAGSTNFVRSCCEEVAVDDVDPLRDVILNGDGSWDAAGLKRMLRERRIEDPWPLYQHVLECEFTNLAPVIGDERAASLKQQIWEIRQATAV